MYTHSCIYSILLVNDMAISIICIGISRNCGDYFPINYCNIFLRIFELKNLTGF